MKIDGFRILHLRRSWISQPQDLTLMKMMDFSELSSCVDLRDRVYGMIGIAFDCKNGQIVPDYNKSLMEVYGDVMFHVLYHSSSKSEDGDQTWSRVRNSQLVQRALFRVSTGLSEQGSLLPDSKPDEFTEGAKLEIKGLIYGTVIGTVKLEPGDMWWAHPGFVKPIPSDFIIRQLTGTKNYPFIKKFEVVDGQTQRIRLVNK
jgi:hypothetical protein